MKLLLASVLLASPAFAADLPRVPVNTEVEVQQFLDRVRRGVGNATIVTTHPNGARRGRYGDQVIYRDGTSYRLCTNVSTGPDGGTSWNCDALTDTGICFEGTTTDEFETCIAVVNPTQDNNIILPDASLNFTATAPALAFGTTNSSGAAATFVRNDAGLAIFDTTVPVTQAFSDAAATGSAAFAARRDHKHGMPSGIAFESARVSEALNYTNGAETGTDVSVTLDVQSRVVVILTGVITVDQGTTDTITIRRDATVKETYGITGDILVNDGVNMSWSETLAAGTYAFDIQATSDVGATSTLDYQLQVLAVPNT